ncbi:uncharacterized protein LOC106753350 [Vigna radiata var. radiata]|uniref:Uncharacterized protein LOC106753350 n=1 Tax=Vigna radiata var. radiata TaxID=3916 RepID=A0A1S3TA45_VIGRR|nr:uncharacterized protein LOC106753350 [Vigna radiata var. radiata]
MPPQLANLHPVFHISQLRKYVPDPSHVLEVEDVQAREDLSVEVQPVRVEESQTKQPRGKTIRLVKVVWDEVLAELPMGIKNISQTQQLCNLCGGDHINRQCAYPKEMQQDVNYMGNQFQYKQGGFNQGTPSQGWKNHPSIGQNQNNTSGQVGGFRQQQPSPLWQQVSSLIETVRDLSGRFDKFLKVYESQLNSNQASFRALETQIGQLSKRVETTEKSQFRGNTDVNPKDECKVVMTNRKRKTVEEIIEIKSSEDEDEKRMQKYDKRIKYYLGEVIDLDGGEDQDRLVKPRKKDHPLKLKDSGTMTLPSVINDVDIGRAIIDSGSSVNLMPFSVFKKIGGLKLKPEHTTLTVADGSTKKLVGTVEDAIVRIDELEILLTF